MPLAPVRLSTTTGWPSLLQLFAEQARGEIGAAARGKRADDPDLLSGIGLRGGGCIRERENADECSRARCRIHDSRHASSRDAGLSPDMHRSPAFECAAAPCYFAALRFFSTHPSTSATVWSTSEFCMPFWLRDRLHEPVDALDVRRTGRERARRRRRRSAAIARLSRTSRKARGLSRPRRASCTARPPSRRPRATLRGRCAPRP